MLYNAFNGQLNTDGTVMDYIKFGSGPRNLIMIPGLGDGLKTVKGLALPMAFMYREFAKDFTVWTFSRKQPLKLTPPPAQWQQILPGLWKAWA